MRLASSLAIALWNYAPPSPGPPVGSSKSFTLEIRHKPAKTAWVTRLDADHGNVMTAYNAMGRPADPTPEQIAKLRDAGRPSPPEAIAIHDGKLKLSVPPQGIVMVEIP